MGGMWESSNTNRLQKKLSCEDITPSLPLSSVYGEKQHKSQANTVLSMQY